MQVFKSTQYVTQAKAVPKTNSALLTHRFSDSREVFAVCSKRHNDGFTSACRTESLQVLGIR
jgi:hypothetical protein